MKPETRRGRVSEHGRGLGTVTEEMVEARAREIAETNGRPPEKLTQNDIDQARSELLGRQATAPELKEDFREHTEVPGQAGRRAPTRKQNDEQTLAEELVDEGLREAEHEQMMEGNRESRSRDQR